jgi:hypothetical protein
VKEKRSFSIEMKSKKDLTNFTLVDKNKGHVVIKGCLGTLRELNLLEEVMLEVLCENGTLRLELSKNELRNIL